MKAALCIIKCGKFLRERRDLLIGIKKSLVWENVPENMEAVLDHCKVTTWWLSKIQPTIIEYQ